MSGQVCKYRMFVQVRWDLTPEEQAQYLASQFRKNSVMSSPTTWPMRDTGEFVYARRRRSAKAFYRELRNIKPILQIKAEKVTERVPGRRGDEVAMRAWRGFIGMEGTINNARDEVRHFAANERGLTACGIQFTTWFSSVGKPQCPICLAAAVEKHPEMKEYL